MPGLWTSKRRMLLPRREHDLLAPTRVGFAGSCNHDGTIILDAVDVLYGVPT